MTRCPSHDDREPSLSIRDGDDRKVLVHCHAGCELRAQFKNAGCRMTALDEAIAEGNGDMGGRGPTQADTLIELAQSAELFHTPDGTGFADLDINGHRETWPIRAVDLAAAQVVQDAREVKTKFSKSFTTWFFSGSDDLRAIVEGWIGYLRDQKLWGSDDPLFPATEVVNGTGLNEVSGLARRHWSNAGPIRAIFRDAFTLAGLTHFNPHSLRKTLAQLGGARVPHAGRAESVVTEFGARGRDDHVAQLRGGSILGKRRSSGICTKHLSLVWMPQAH